MYQGNRNTDSAAESAVARVGCTNIAYQLQTRTVDSDFTQPAVTFLCHVIVELLAVGPSLAVDLLLPVDKEKQAGLHAYIHT